MRRGISASFRYAAAGLYHMWRTERNMRIHVAAAAVVLWLSVTLALPEWAWAIIVVAAGSVIATESINTAIERIGDLLAERSELMKAAKDTAAAAVLITAFAAAGVGIGVFLPRLSYLPEAIVNSVHRGCPWFLVTGIIALVTLIAAITYPLRSER